MPENVNEKLWNKAKDAFKKQYKKDAKTSADYALVSSIYKKMGGKFGKEMYELVEQIQGMINMKEIKESVSERLDSLREGYKLKIGDIVKVYGGSGKKGVVVSNDNKWFRLKKFDKNGAMAMAIKDKDVKQSDDMVAVKVDGDIAVYLNDETILVKKRESVSESLRDLEYDYNTTVANIKDILEEGYVKFGKDKIPIKNMKRKTGNTWVARVDKSVGKYKAGDDIEFDIDNYHESINSRLNKLLEAYIDSEVLQLLQMKFRTDSYFKKNYGNVKPTRIKKLSGNTYQVLLPKAGPDGKDYWYEVYFNQTSGILKDENGHSYGSL